MNKLLAILFLLPGLALAAPKKITAVYDVTRNGQPFATVTENYVQEGSRYHIESLTSGIGIYALFGKRKMVSEGEVTAEGLRPVHFEQLHDDRKKGVADFDWNTQTLTMTNAKGKSSTSPLEPGALDLASFAYQFMFQPPKGELLAIPLTTGKKLRTYSYRVAPQQEMLDGVKTLRISQEKSGKDSDGRELWLAVEKHFLPAKIIMTDENDGKLEQVLTDLKVE